MKFAPCDKHTGMTGLSCMRLRHDDGRPATDAEVWAELERMRADQAGHDLPERAAAAIAAIGVMQRAAQQAAESESPNAELRGRSRLAGEVPLSDVLCSARR